MQASIRTLILAFGLGLAAVAGAQQAPAAPPAGFTAPADPRPDESNAERAKSQPGNNAPFWRAVRESGEQAGYTSLPGAEKGVLIQPFVQYPGSRYTTAGEAWRQVRNQWILPYGAALIAIALLAVAMFYWRRGPMGGHEPETGRVIERFTYFERAAHWTVAIAFVVLAVSGIVMAWGKYFLLPVLGGTLFGWLTYALKNAHNFAGPLFAVALVVFIVGFIRENLPRAHDLKWLAKGGGMFGGEHVPSGKFNAGEKIVFWGGVIVLGLTVAASGLVLDKVFPTLLEYTRPQMQVALMIHVVASILMMAMFVGHIYMGTLGVKGAYQAMRTGYVDEGWAKEHHQLWYEDVKAGRTPAKRSADAAPAPVVSAGAQG
ncbi:MAG: formate dehydrogenase subunit gamma [Rubrivivax sp.]|nr:formate dehydrogenase subunit gamma [Rubrivivax sp.]